MDYDIIVPSKGRSTTGNTFAMLKRTKLPYIVVVEKEDEEAYRSVHDRLWILPKSGNGIGYSRAYILEHALRPFVMIDDDITRFCCYSRASGLVNVSARRFLQAGWVQMQKLPDIGMLGYKNGTFAIPIIQKITHPTTIAHVVFIRPEILRKYHIAYDARLRVFEDIDILLQSLHKGIAFLRLNRWIYFTPSSGTSQDSGGIDYRNALKQRYLRVMAKRYPKQFLTNNEIRASDGQPTYQIIWKLPYI